MKAGEPTKSKTVQKLGFKKMDVVKTIKGEPVDNPQKAMELYNQMEAHDLAVVERQPASNGTADVEIKSLNAIIAKARPDEQKDLSRLLEQLRIVPVEHQGTDNPVFKVVWVESGSVFDREGLKAGDLVTSNARSH
ncbi:MAG: hypothetical protein AB7G93_16765 [Bdellovibrionales bacterium]